MAKISVIVPVYNVESYLEECLDSILNQSLEDIEVLCVDDGSSDRSPGILGAYAEKDPRVRVFRNESNRGQSYARNIGIEQASGAYIMFVDADDVIDLKLLEEAVSQMASVDSTGQVDFVCFGYQKRDEIWGGADGQSPCTEKGFFQAADYFIRSVESGNIIYSPWSKLYRRSFLMEKSIRFAEGMIYEDVVFHLECMLRAGTICCIPDRLYTYRVRGGSTMTKPADGRSVTDYFRVLCRITRIFLDTDTNGCLEEAVEKYIQHVYWWTKNAYHKYISADGAYQLKRSIPEKSCAKLYGLFARIEEGTGRIQGLAGEQAERLKRSRHIIVYGAGNIARDVVSILEREDIPIDGIAVTSLEGNRKSLLGNKVREITRYVDQKDDSLVILATAEDVYPAIEKKLQELGFSDYMKLL